ncbi:hypothetical protein L7F22_020235 [Adiantum nelumboides]|nr:hypothetical protein [Adiantum nelumboides]
MVHGFLLFGQNGAFSPPVKAASPAASTRLQSNFFPIPLRGLRALGICEDPPMPAVDPFRINRNPALLLFSSVAAAAVVVLASLYPASAASNISLGSKLLPTDIEGWVSADRSFRLSFYTSSADSSRFSVGVLYNLAGINGTVAWTAGNDSQVDPASSFELSSDGNLILRNGSGTVVWNSGTSKMGVAAASMGDDGNFALVNSSGSTLWQSFDSLTDTLVSGQRLQKGTSLTAGPYRATLQASGNLSLIFTSNGGYTYWSSDTAGDNSAYAFLDNGSGTLSIFSEAGEAVKSWSSKDYTSTASPSPVRRITLGPDGNLRIFTTSAGDWVTGWEALEDYCGIFAYCGPYGLCGYNASSLICTCATQAGYTLNDERNPRGGCKLTAGNSGQHCAMVELNRTILFVSGNDNRNFRYGDSECSAGCLANSECTAATALSDGSGICQTVLTNNLFSGIQELSISTNSFFKFCGSNVPPGMTSSPPVPLIPGSEKRGSSVTVSVVVSVLATLAVLAICQVGIWWLCCRKNPRWGGYSAHYALLEYASGAPVQFTYRELRKATKNFREKLGEGGFGAVYKGEMPTTGSAGAVMEVAVKRLEGLAEQGEKQFRMEVAVIGSTHHMNLVRLCGFCAEGRHRLLVYEYMKNLSLDKYLFAAGEGDEQQLRLRSDMDWETRYNVLLGTARGITYLHQECRDCIIHSDIKPENILLDGTFTAKVSDFGLAKLTRTTAAAHNASGHHITNVLRGTRGYLAPEWRSNLPITVKADVFSYGMVVLETISGCKSFEAPVVDTSAESARHVTFPEWAYRQYFLHRRVEGVVDERIKSEVDTEQLDRAMKVAFWCLQVQPSMRPSMGKVIQMLDGSMQDTQVPPMPKSFGDQMASITNQEDLVRALEIESSVPPSSSVLTSYANTSDNTTSLNSSSHRPKYTVSQSLVRHQVPPPPSNVHSSF